ncbi:rhodanese-like domain-containing protein [Streptomyces polygonati]|uniref:Rhodanese-like domain-containing protein n=1 Tax=Streptomyces polygonati TaxID=1617087 RepID=A0ABV8HQW2_9ACTN
MVRPIDREDVKKRIDAGSAVVLEALPPSYYEEGHLPGALNMPLDDIDTLAPGLLPDKQTEVIVYCSDGPCANSGIAAKRLEELGYTNVAEYALGKKDWIEGGLPTVSTSITTQPTVA